MFLDRILWLILVWFDISIEGSFKRSCVLLRGVDC